MYTRIADFKQSWNEESASTLKVLEALTDSSLTQPVADGSRTLGRIAWHITITVPEMTRRTGLDTRGPAEGAPVPAAASEIAEAYASASHSLLEVVESKWTDASLEEEDEMYGQRWKRGRTLHALVTHQAHHRGQMTILMRQAGLAVPGIYGPSREEWSSYGMEPPAI